MKELDLTFSRPDWIFIRQALSLALYQKKTVRISGISGFFHENSRYWPLYEDIRKIVSSLGAGELNFTGGAITFVPAPLRFGRRVLATGKFSSIPEIVLFLVPVLFSLKFRSILEISGVTNPVASHSSSQLKALFSFFEELGIFCSYGIKRYGFYGSGGGSAEARIYPAEFRKRDISFRAAGAVSGARVLHSGLSSGLAKKEKEILMAELGLPENRISILEVLDCDGIGNSVDIHLDARGTGLVLTKEMRIYNHAGEPVFDPDDCIKDLYALIAEARAAGGVFPEAIAREIVPFIFLSGSTTDSTKSEMILETEEMCGKILL